MTTLYLDAATYDALDPVDWAAVVESAAIPVRLGEPARLHGTFIDTDEGTVFVADDTGPEWVAWDDPRLTEAHAVAVAASLEV